MNRRSLFKAALAGACLGLARHLPMPKQPEVVAEPETSVWTVEWSNENVTLAEFAKRNGPIDGIVVVLSQQNEILRDVVFCEAEDRPHKVTLRTPLPPMLMP